MGDSPAATVLAALSAEPAGAAVAVIAGHASISVAADTATRVKGSRPGIAYTWTPAVPEAPRDEAPPDKPRAYRLAQRLAR